MHIFLHTHTHTHTHTHSYKTLSYPSPTHTHTHTHTHTLYHITRGLFIAVLFSQHIMSGYQEKIIRPIIIKANEHNLKKQKIRTRLRHGRDVRITKPRI